MFIQIRTYGASMDPDGSNCVMHFCLTDSTSAKADLPDVQTLAAILKILQTEKPVFRHSVTGRLATGWEPVGEAE